MSAAACVVRIRMRVTPTKATKALTTKGTASRATSVS